jgi:hypothetical protein
MRSTITSRWSSPIPEMTVWSVSSSVRTWKVGSFLGEGEEGLAHLVLVDLRSSAPTATWMTGSGNSRFSSTISWPGLTSESPVRVFLKPDAGGDVAGEHGVDVLAVVGVHLQDAADALLVGVGGVHHGAALLERARVDAEVGELADVGSDMILNASAANGSLSDGLRSSSSCP